MQITINTDTDDLPAVIRMLQALNAAQETRLVEKHAAALRPGIIKSGTDHESDGGGLVPAPTLPPCAAHADEPDEEPTPEQVFAAPKSLFDAPSPEPAQPPPPHSDVTVDAAGLPWDARIHSGAKTKLANGNWKLLRGVDPALVASVEAELRGDPKPAAPTMLAVAQGAEPAIAPPPPAPVVPPVGVPSPPAPLPIPPAPKPITNAAELVAAVMDKRFTTDQVNAACQAVGVENVASLLAKQEMLPLVLKELGV